MKPKIQFLIVVAFLGAALPGTSKAQDPVSLVIKEGIKKAIVAIDLKIQRLQNETIWLQNAQKVVENKLSKVKLEEIAHWAEKQKRLYEDYFEELWRVKAALAYFQGLKEIIDKQGQLVCAYGQAMNLFRQDPHFSGQELAYMERVYRGILDQSLQNLEEVSLVVQSFSTQMSDAGRLEILGRAKTSLQQNYVDLQAFNRQNALLSLARAKDQKEVERIKIIYGLQ